MKKIIVIIKHLFKSKFLSNVFYYSLFFVSSILIISGIGNYFSTDSFDQAFGISCFLIGAIIIILLWKYEKVF